MLSPTSSFTLRIGNLGYLNGTITSLSQSAASTTGAPPATTPAVTPINSHNPSAKEWDLHDSHIAGIVYQNIKDPRSIGVTQDMSANMMWTTLTGQYDTASAATQTLTKERIQQYKYVPGTPFKEYFKQVEGLCKAASDVGCTITDDDLCSCFLMSLSADYLWVLQTHGACTYPDLKHALMEYDMMVESATAVPGNAIAQNALAAVGCSGSGIVCNNCKCVSHIKKNCWVYGGGSEGKGPRWYNAPKGMELNKSAENLTVAASTSDPSLATSNLEVWNTMVCSSPSDSSLLRLGRETFALLSGVRGDANSVNLSSVVHRPIVNINTVPTFIDSAASHTGIHNHCQFVKYTPACSSGCMAAEGTDRKFVIEDFGIAEIMVKMGDGEIH
ncbi:hypothetical protein GYMLUDRAFT_239546 [Collybiopsis luxurians FD-317 M1]|nr:hypothetical protein GYMLUDRAFT_239546 [Collybiopsis luxurians FD-317 M1]